MENQKTLEPPPRSSPWGTVHKFQQPLPNLPIWVVNTDHDGGYMVEVQWADRNLTGIVVASVPTFCGDGVYWYCFEQDHDWMLLLWDYPPLFDIYHALGDAVDQLESSINWVFPAFLSLYQKLFSVVDDVI